MRGTHVVAAFVGTMAAMLTGIAWAAAPKGKTAATPAEVRRGGIGFVVKSVKVTARDTEEPPFPAQERTPGHGTLQASWPVAKSEAPEWKKWNAAVFNVTQELVNSYAKDEKDPGQRRPDGWVPDAIANLELDATAHLPGVNGNLVSTRIDEEIEMHGGAHPVEKWIYYHWLLKEGRELQAGDVFSPDDAWKAFVTKQCDIGLHKQPNINSYLWKDDGQFTRGEYTKGLAETIQTPRNWKIGPQGLTVVFPEYAVSPRVATPDGVTISWNDLRPYLASGFEPPK